MQGKVLFEYAVIRLVPRVEREEFINLGVILYCRDKKFLAMKYVINDGRINSICGNLDCKDLITHLASFENIANGGGSGGPIGQLDIASRFRWLTAARSTIVQTSKVHPGFCQEPSETLAQLFQQLVM